MSLAIKSTDASEINAITALYTADEEACVRHLAERTNLMAEDRKAITSRARKIIETLRANTEKLKIVDAFLQEYGLSTAEGVALMRLSEALIRTPDFETARLLIRDKIHNGDWASHTGQDRPALTNAGGHGLSFSKAWIKATGGATAENLLAKLGDRVFAFCVTKAMSIIGDHFVLGETIEGALQNGQVFSEKGYTFSFDMLGEAAMTKPDAERYFEKYMKAARAVSSNADHPIDTNNISVKLSALHPRYEFNKLDDCAPVLVDGLLKLAAVARKGGFSITIDAEETDRLEASLTIFEDVLRSDELNGWNGIGLVVQAYQKRAPAVIDWIVSLAQKTGKQIPVRLVKGAYWDTEIKRAQELGLADYPVFTKKAHTDVSYLACAKQMLDAGDALFPQFATHNAHSAAAIIHMAKDRTDYEFQRLHGMGEQLHDVLMTETGVRSRIYAPVGPHKDLLPYLVRRLLENGANSSFVNQLMDETITPDTIVRDPVEIAEEGAFTANPMICKPRDYLFGERLSAKGADWTQSGIAAQLTDYAHKAQSVSAASIVDGVMQSGETFQLHSPANIDRLAGEASNAKKENISAAIDSASKSTWATKTSAETRAEILRLAADMLEEEQATFIGLCVSEAGKSIPDAIGEIREAVDFLRYYANEACKKHMASRQPLGVVACISPWNFPLAIFLGQVTAALSVGNCVVAKPADQTPLIAFKAIQLLHRAGVPGDALHLVIGSGAGVGEPLVKNPAVQGVCFTGSTATAKRIAANLADTDRPAIPFIAETGGLNAMIIDSTALLEQAVRDVIASAFQSAGQRCSACRIVCIQEDIAEEFDAMLRGAVAELKVGDPQSLQTDVGPVIDKAAHQKISSYIANKKNVWETIAEGEPTDQTNNGTFILPIAFRIPHISAVEEEIFGPVLHVLPFKAENILSLVEDINNLGYGLTMGLHTRIDTRVDQIANKAHVGNLYINRNQIGALVGVQPFGGEGMSGTGPKAGGPHYLLRLTKHKEADTTTLSPSLKNGSHHTEAAGTLATAISRAHSAQKNLINTLGIHDRITALKPLLDNGNTDFNVIEAFSAQGVAMPSPTGESNRLRLVPRGVMLLWPSNDESTLTLQIGKALIAGSSIVALASEELAKTLTNLKAKITANGLPDSCIEIIPDTAFSADTDEIDTLSCLIAEPPYSANLIPVMKRASGPILSVLSAHDPIERFFHERVVTIDTTAAGGNASLLANS